MKKLNYVIKDAVGIHARPAGALVALIKDYKSSITIHKGSKSADARRLFSIMSLGVKCGDEVTIEADGEDEELVIEALNEFLKNNL